MQKKSSCVWSIFEYKEGCFRVIQAGLASQTPTIEDNRLASGFCTREQYHVRAMACIVILSFSCDYLFQVLGVEPLPPALSSRISEHPGYSGLHDVQAQYLFAQGKSSQNCYLMFLGVIMSILFLSGRECRNLVRRFKEAEMYNTFFKSVR